MVEFTGTESQGNLYSDSISSSQSSSKYTYLPNVSLWIKSMCPSTQKHAWEVTRPKQIPFNLNTNVNMTSCVKQTDAKIYLDMIELSIWYVPPQAETRPRFRWSCRRVWRGGKVGTPDRIRANRNSEPDGCEGNHFRFGESQPPHSSIFSFLKWSCVLIKGNSYLTDTHRWYLPLDLFDVSVSLCVDSSASN